MNANRNNGSRPLHALAVLVFAKLLLVAGVWADIPTNVKPVSIGLGGYAYWSSSPFANTVLSGGNWIEYGEFQWGSEVLIQNTDGSPNPQFDANGCPQYLNPGKKLRLLVWPNSVSAPAGAPASWPDRGITGIGKWVVTWQGAADIRLQTGTFIPGESSGGATGSLVNGRRVYQITSNPIGHITIEAVSAADPITDIKIWLPDPANPQNQSLESSGSIWHPTFLATIASADFNHLQDADGDASWKIFSLYIAGGPGTVVESDPRGTFSGASSLPWTNVHTLDSAVIWSGLQRGAAYVSSGGSALAPGAVNYPDGTGVELFPATDSLRFSVSQGQANESDSTLASAVTDNEYWQFTVTPQPGQPLNLRNAEFKLTWRRDSYHSSRKFAVMSSVGGFTAGQQVYTLATTPDNGTVSETVFKLPDTVAYNALTSPIEVRIYFYGGQYGGSHPTSLLGVKLTRDAAAILTPYETWTAAQAWNGADSGPAADPNGDGISNLIAYALDIAPLSTANSASLPRLEINNTVPAGPWLTFTYRENQSATDLTYTVRSSTDLATWQALVIDNVNAFEEIADPNPDGDNSVVLMRLRLKYNTAATPKQFFKLSISR